MLAYTGASRNSGINNWEVTKRHIDGDRNVQQRFARIRDIAVAMRAALERRRLGRGRAADRRRSGKTASGSRLASRRRKSTPCSRAARDAGATGGKVCGAGGGGCLFCLGEPADVPAIRQALAAHGGAAARLHDRDRRTARREPHDSLGPARESRQPGHRPCPRRDRRPPRNQGREPVQDPRVPQRAETIAHTAERVADLTTAQRLAIPGIGKDLAAKIGELVETGAIALSPGTARGVSRRPSSICCASRASGPKTVAMLYRELGIGTLDDLERRGTRRTRCATSRAWAPRRKRSSSRRSRNAQRSRRPPADGGGARHRRRARRRAARARARGATSRPSAASGAAARPAAISTSSPPARRRR